MNQQFRKFIRNLILFSVALAVPGIIFSLTVAPRYYSPALPYLYLLFFIVTLVTYYLALKYVKKKISSFVNFYMLTTFIKLLLFIIIIVVYLMVNKPDALPFVVSFFILYLLFTVFEVVNLLHITKSENR